MAHLMWALTDLTVTTQEPDQEPVTNSMDDISNNGRLVRQAVPIVSVNCIYPGNHSLPWRYADEENPRVQDIIIDAAHECPDAPDDPE